MIEDATRRFVRSWKKWPHTRLHDDELLIEVDPFVGDNYSFVVTHVGSAPNTGHSVIGLRVDVYEDTWQAFADFPEFFAGLARLRSNHKTGWKPALEDVEALLRELGFTEDSEPVVTHVHSFRCTVCGGAPEERS